MVPFSGLNGVRANQTGGIVDRRGFFRRLGGQETPVRPPWTLSEDSFRTACTGCGNCWTACPEKIIVSDTEGRAKVNFSQGSCSFCEACADACVADAFLRERQGVQPWTVKAQITSACLERNGIACRACDSACDAAALRFRPLLHGRSEVFVEADRCTGCGACQTICPVSAIRLKAIGAHRHCNHKEQEDAA